MKSILHFVVSFHDIIPHAPHVYMRQTVFLENYEVTLLRSQACLVTARPPSKNYCRRSHVTRKIPARKLYRVTLICGDHEINSGSIAAITPHAVGRRSRIRWKRPGGSSEAAWGSPEVPTEERRQEVRGRAAQRRDPSRCRGRRRRSRKKTDGEKRKGARPASYSAPPLEIIACSCGISECGRKAVSGERQGPELGCGGRKRVESERRTSVYEDGVEGGDVVSNPSTREPSRSFQYADRCTATRRSLTMARYAACLPVLFARSSALCIRVGS